MSQKIGQRTQGAKKNSSNEQKNRIDTENSSNEPIG